jgi:hypothetical protein
MSRRREQSMSPLLPALAARRWLLWWEQVRAARSGDLCPVLPEAVPDFEIAIRRKDVLTAPGQRIAHAVSLLFGCSIVVSKSRPR